MTQKADRLQVPRSAVTAHMDGEAVVLHLDTRRYFRLNTTATRVWQGLEAGRDRPQILDDLCSTFAVDHGTAATELDRLLAELESRRLISRVSGDPG